MVVENRSFLPKMIFNTIIKNANSSKSFNDDANFLLFVGLNKNHNVVLVKTLDTNGERKQKIRMIWQIHGQL